jgi:hypothetical protein
MHLGEKAYLTNIIGADIPCVKERKDHPQRENVIELVKDRHLCEVESLLRKYGPEREESCLVTR